MTLLFYADELLHVLLHRSGQIYGLRTGVIDMATIGDLSRAQLRRDIHQYPEAGWKEFRTTALVAEELAELGYATSLGSDALAVNERLGTPSAADLESAEQRALEEDAPEKYIKRMDGVTGLIAEKEY